MQITFCPSCGGKKLKKVRRNLVEDYHGQWYMAPDVEFHECPDCGEKVYDPEAMRKIEAVSPAFKGRSAVVDH